MCPCAPSPPPLSPSARSCICPSMDAMSARRPPSSPLVSSATRALSSATSACRPSPPRGGAPDPPVLRREPMSSLCRRAASARSLESACSTRARRCSRPTSGEPGRPLRTADGGSTWSDGRGASSPPGWKALCACSASSPTTTLACASPPTVVVSCCACGSCGRSGRSRAAGCSGDRSRKVMAYTAWESACSPVEAVTPTYASAGTLTRASPAVVERHDEKWPCSSRARATWRRPWRWDTRALMGCGLLRYWAKQMPTCSPRLLEDPSPLCLPWSSPTPTIATTKGSPLPSSDSYVSKKTPRPS
mmetsp:Transcript_27541/g.92075  ORF Transcript_27541/g.92075 Transcript_27541/m.92075 type:complete len:304 (-) Transcript_27541:416-1327(-)